MSEPKPEPTHESVIREALEAGARGDWLAVNFQHALAALDAMVTRHEHIRSLYAAGNQNQATLRKAVLALEEESKRLKRLLEGAQKSNEMWTRASDRQVEEIARLKRESIPQRMLAAFDEAKAQSYEAGAAWMREKAAAVADHHGDDRIADRIRALPTREGT